MELQKVYDFHDQTLLLLRDVMFLNFRESHEN